MDFHQFEMFDRNERILAVPPSEWERRWNGVRRIMQDNNVGVLLVYGSRPFGLWLSGYNRQLFTVVPEEGDLVEVWRGESCYLNTQAFDPVESGESAVKHVQRITDPDWNAIRKLVAAHDNRLGLMNAGTMTKADRAELAREIPGAVEVSLDVEVSVFQCVKSAFELELVHASMRMHDNIQKAVPAILRKGRPMKEVSDDLRHLALQNGTSADDMCLMLLTHDLDGKNIEVSVSAPGRRFQDGDVVEVLIETDGPGGYYSAVMRQYAFGQPTDAFMAQYEIAKKANLLAGSLMYEGNTLRKIADQVNDYIMGAGYVTDNCCFMHGMGYGMGEAPFMRDATNPFDSYQPTESIPLKAGMISLAHPHVGRKTEDEYSRHEMMRIANTWEVTPTGGKSISQIPLDLILL